MKGLANLPTTTLVTAAALAAAVTLSPMGVVAASANTSTHVNPGAIDIHYHRIHDRRGGIPLISGLALGLIGAGAAELYPYYYSPPFYYGGPYVGAYYFRETPTHSKGWAFNRGRRYRRDLHQHRHTG